MHISVYTFITYFVTSNNYIYAKCPKTIKFLHYIVESVQAYESIGQCIDNKLYHVVNCLPVSSCNPFNKQHLQYLYESLG